MSMASLKYLGNLRVECKHNASGGIIITDAPVDNHGKGEAFSPTDLCATSLAACAMTIMGIYAEAHNVNLSGMSAEVDKTMSANPRRIAKIEVTFHMPNRDYSEKEKVSLERAVRTCPVHVTLGESVEQNLIIKWAR